MEIEEKTRTNSGSRRKDTIKNITIAFLVILLLLTFFSNTFMNYSLPEVATQMIQSGQISPQIRGSGTVSADDPYNVMVSEVRKIGGVLVNVGDEVRKDDIIYTLEDQEPKEMTDAKDELDKMALAYEQSLFSGDIPDSVITNVRNNKRNTYDNYQAQLKDINDRFVAATQADAQAQAQLDLLTRDENYAKADNNGNTNTYSQQYLSSEATYDAAVANAKITEIQEKLNAFSADQTSSEEYTDLEGQRAYWEGILAGISVDQAEYTKDKTQLDLYKQAQNDQLTNTYAKKVAIATNVKTETARALADVTKERSDLYKSIQTELALFNQKDQMAKVRDKIEALQEKSVGASIKAPVDGKITALTYVAGESTNPDKAAAVIQVAGKPMTVSFSITNEQARKLHVADPARPQNDWYYTDFKATLKSIRNDASDPAGKKSAVFEIQSTEVQPGQQVSLVMGESAQNYDMTVPNSAIREDTNGKFILTITQRSSPLGNRYVATRNEIKVLAADDTTTAISTSAELGSYVITTATKPVTPGQQVRLSNENS